MTDTLRDQLLGLGFKPAPAPAPCAPSGAPTVRSSGRVAARAPLAGVHRIPTAAVTATTVRRATRATIVAAIGPQATPRHGPPAAGRDGAHSAAAGDPRGPRRSHGQGQGQAQVQAGSGNASAGVGAPAGTAAPSNRPAGANATRRGGRKPHGPREDIDLAKAYAIRAQREKDERMDAEPPEAGRSETAPRGEGQTAGTRRGQGPQREGRRYLAPLPLRRQDQAHLRHRAAARRAELGEAGRAAARRPATSSWTPRCWPKPRRCSRPPWH